MVDLSKYVGELKTKQDAHDQYRAQVLQQADRFWAGLTARLDEFVKRAQAAKLDGVGPCKQTEYSDDVVELTCTLNHDERVFVVPRRAHPKASGSEDLSTKIVLFFKNQDDAKAFGEIGISHTRPGPLTATFAYYDLDGDLIPLDGWSPVDENAGRQAADAVIDVVYSIRTLWSKQTTLEMWRKGSALSQGMGFLGQR